MVKKNKKKVYLNITNDKCPITFVKTKLALEKLKNHQFLEVHVKAGEALYGMPSSLKEIGFKIKEKNFLGDDVYSLKIIKLDPIP